MNFAVLFTRAVKSGFIMSILYHGFMLLTGTPVTVNGACVWTVIFILLYFLWLVLVSYRGRRR